MHACLYVCVCVCVYEGVRVLVVLQFVAPLGGAVAALSA
jgi:hypothetical protein